ncbi:MAG: hypothetical protein OCU22_07905 [Canidatus Methanoxibalbensis ujae]|nr:hypothetical protein [Candidatus Methanoxibalbensis ujae]
MRQQTDTIGYMDDDGMGEAVAVSDRVYVLPNDGKVKLYLKGGVAYVADLGKDEMDSGTTVYAFASFSYNPDCLFLQPDCGEIKEYRWTVCYTQNTPSQILAMLQG